MSEIIPNLYKLIWEEEKLKFKNEENMKCNSKVDSSRDIKKQRENEKVEEDVTIGTCAD